MARPGNNEKANLRLQIRNTAYELNKALDLWRRASELVDEAEEKLFHLEDKLRAMEKASGQDKKQNTQKRRKR